MKKDLFLNNMQVNSHWEVDNGIFKKYFFDEFDSSLNKYKKLHEVAMKNSFYAPEVMNFNRDESTISFKYIENLISIKNTYIDYMTEMSPKQKSLDLLYEAGVLLGAIHTDMNLDVQCKSDEPEYIKTITKKWLNRGGYENLSDTPHAYIHGDYGFPNVNIIGSNSDLNMVVIDPCPNYSYTFSVNLFSSVYVDLATFFSCLDGRVGINNYFYFKWNRLNDVKDAFLSGYETRTKHTIDRCLLACLTCAVTESYFLRKYGGGFRAFIAHKIIHNPLKHNVPSSYCRAP